MTELTWRQKNKDKIKMYNEKYNTYVDCDVCNRKIKKTSMYSHTLTKLHIFNSKYKV
jgi:hypothetical protein